MSDLVERLRNLKRTMQWFGTDVVVATCNQSADRIEELEAQIASIRGVITQHHLAYDRREHGGVADGHLAAAVQKIMGMEWHQGATLAYAAGRSDKAREIREALGAS